MLLVGLNESSLVPHIISQLKDSELAIQMASRLNLPGADDLYQYQFNQLLQQGTLFYNTPLLIVFLHQYQFNQLIYYNIVMTKAYLFCTLFFYNIPSYFSFIFFFLSLFLFLNILKYHFLLI